MAYDELWFKGCRTKAERAARSKELDSYKPAFEALTEILRKKFPEETAVRDYSNPNWHIEQIRRNEENHIISQIKKLTVS